VPEQARLIFVGGLHRSGTTPLARVLGGHPQVSGLTDTGVPEDEGQHLQGVYPKIRTHGGLGRFATVPAAHLTEESSLCTPENKERLLASWRPYWDASRRFWLEKSPPNLIMGRFLQGLFPDSFLIMVVRHPVAVALASHKWNPILISRKGRWRRTLPGLVENWVAAHRILEADSPRLERLLVVNYEHLSAQPEAELERIQHHLGLPTPIDGSAITGDHSSGYEEAWAAMRTGTPLRRYSRHVIERRFSADVRHFGYDLADLSELVRWDDR